MPELKVEKLAPGCMGLARLNGEVLFLPESLPDETVRVELLERKKGVRTARILEVISPSPWRVSPDCPFAKDCGGCDFIHVHPDKALQLKSDAALGELADGYKLPIELVASPLSNHYRSRATLHLGLNQQGLMSAGFYNSKRQLVEFSSCGLLRPELNQLSGSLKSWAAALPRAAAGLEAAVIAGLSPDELAVVFSPAPPKKESDPSRHKKPAAKLPECLWPELNRLARLEPGLIIAARPFFGAPPKAVYPSRLPSVTVADWPDWNIKLKAAPGGFTQVNHFINRLMVEKIRDAALPLLKPGGRALDLYAGLGNISLPLHQAGFTVSMVEQAPESLKLARENSKGLPGFNIIGEPTEKALKHLRQKGEKFDLVVLDPPRSGAKDLAVDLAALSPAMIIYIACHPSVLSRDLPAFISLGYKLETLTSFDMFPRTSHLEAMAVLKRL